MKTGKIKGILLAMSILLGLLAVRCAKQGSPTGGPKDEIPPETLSEYPVNRSVQFSEKKITITFNEYIQLKDPSKEIFISPPMRVKPEFKVHGKKLLVEFQEELKADATYTINFGNAIADYTEGNPLTNYEYVFSTGDKVDSLSITGTVLNAFNHQPEADIIAMVYTDDNDTIPLDSLPFRVPPKSASRSLKDGAFRINNLPPGEYLLFALQDMNNNYYFDLPNERIAFLDSLVSVRPPGAPVFLPDSLVADTIAADTLPPIVQAPYKLYLFEETDSTQKLLGRKLFGMNLLSYYFRMPVDSLKISILDYTPEKADWYIEEVNTIRDTFKLWLWPGLPDTIRVRADYGDTLADTTRFMLSRFSDSRPGRKKDEETGKLKIAMNNKGLKDLDKDLILDFSAPVTRIDTNKITILGAADTLNPAIIFTDTLVRRSCLVNFPFREGESYRIIILDSAFFDISGFTNDSTSLAFKVRTLPDYGILIMNINVPAEGSNYIIQLLTEKENLVMERQITSSQTVRFEHLLPGKYKLKVIFDRNGNGKWDVGSYAKRILPEVVQYYAPALDIRANWELQEEWIIGLK